MESTMPFGVRLTHNHDPGPEKQDERAKLELAPDEAVRPLMEAGEHSGDEELKKKA